MWYFNTVQCTLKWYKDMRTIDMYILNYCSTIKNKILSFSWKMMELEDSTLNNINQTQKENPTRSLSPVAPWTSSDQICMSFCKHTCIFQTEHICHHDKHDETQKSQREFWISGLAEILFIQSNFEVGFIPETPAEKFMMFPKVLKHYRPVPLSMILSKRNILISSCLWPNYPPSKHSCPEDLKSWAYVQKCY